MTCGHCVGSEKIFGAKKAKPIFQAALGMNPPPPARRDLLSELVTEDKSPGAAASALLLRQYFMEGWYPSGAPNAPDAFTPTAALVKAMGAEPSRGDRIRSTLGALVLCVAVVGAAGSVPHWRAAPTHTDELTIADSKTAAPIGLAFAGIRIDQAQQADPQMRKGMSGYLLPFVIISVHLLGFHYQYGIVVADGGFQEAFHVDHILNLT